MDNPLEAAKALLSQAYDTRKYRFEEDELQHELNIYDEVVRQFGESSKFEIQLTVAEALKRKAKLYDYQSERSEMDSKYITRHQPITDMKAYELEAAKAAIAVYSELAQRYMNAKAVELQRISIHALMDKATLQRRFRDIINGELDTYDEIVKQFGHCSEETIQHSVANALHSKASSQQQAGAFNDALKTYDEFSKRFGSLTRQSILPVHMWVWRDKAKVYKGLGLWEDVFATYEEAASEVMRLHTPVPYDLVVHLSFLWEEQALAYEERQDFVAAIGVCDRFLGLVKGYEEKNSLKRVKVITLLKASLEYQAGNTAHALRLYDDVLTMCQIQSDWENKRIAAKAIVGICFAQDRSQLFKNAVEKRAPLITKLAHEWQHSPDDVLPEIMSLFSIAALVLGYEKDVKEEQLIIICKKHLPEFVNKADFALDYCLIKAFINRAKALAYQQKFDQAIEIYTELIATFEGLYLSDFAFSNAKNWHSQLEALFQKIRLNLLEVYTKNKKAYQEALLLCDEWLEQISTSQSSDTLNTHDLTVKLLTQKASLYSAIKEPLKAIETYDALIVYCEKLDEPLQSEFIANALESKAFIYEYEKEFNQALLVYKEIIDRFTSTEPKNLRDKLCHAYKASGDIYLSSLGYLKRAVYAYYQYWHLSKTEENITIRDVICIYTVDEILTWVNHIMSILNKDSLLEICWGKTDEQLSKVRLKLVERSAISQIGYFAFSVLHSPCEKEEIEIQKNLCKEVIDRFTSASVAEACFLLVLDAFMDEAAKQEKMGDKIKALEVYRYAVSHFGEWEKESELLRDRLRFCEDQICA